VTDDYTDTGWTIQGALAVHSGCNAGYIINSGIDLVIGESYIVKYNVESITSGYVRALLGNTSGTNVTVAGEFEEELLVAGNTDFSFYSNGNVSISVLSIYPSSQLLINNGKTLSFNEANNKWVNYQSFLPDFMCKFVNSFFLFKDGELWENDVNEVRNNFFGVQYPSKIVFYVNIEPTAIKNFYSMRQKSNKVWSVPEINILPREGKSQGQLSRLKKGRFNRLQGDWFADFMRDMNDPRFIITLDALTKGAELQGNIMKITMENDDITEVRLLSTDITVSQQNYTY
jgi:hypothetical protein